MGEHISFEEMQAFVFPKDLSIDTINLGTRINAHILTCDECAAQYSAMLDMREAAEELHRNRIDAEIAEQAENKKREERDLIDQQFEGESPSGEEGRDTPSPKKDRGIAQ